MPVRVDIPIRIRVDPGALTERRDELEAALVANTRRALENSRDVMVAQRSTSMGLMVHSPEIIWTGEGLGSVPGRVRSEINERLQILLNDLVREVGLGESFGAGESIPELESVWRLGQRYPILLAEVATARHEQEARVVGGGGVQEPTCVDDDWRSLCFRLQEAFAMCEDRNQFNEGTHIGFIKAQSVGNWEFAIWRRGDRIIGNFRDFWYSFRSSWEEQRVHAFGYPVIFFDVAYNQTTEELEVRQSNTIPPPQLTTIYQYQGAFETAEQRRGAFLELGYQVLPREATDLLVNEYRESEVVALVLSFETGLPILLGFDTENYRELSETAQFRLGDRANLLLSPYIMAQIPSEQEGGTAGATGPSGIVGTENLEGRKRRPVAFPRSARTGTAVTPECNAFLGEPPLEKLGADGERLRRLIEEIAFRMNIQPCSYAGAFCLFAADALGVRAVGVTEYFTRPTAVPRNPTMNVPLTRDETGTLRVVRGDTGNLGSAAFEPTQSPAIQFMRHLAGVTPLITRLSHLIEQIYTNHEDKFRGCYENRVPSWYYRLVLELRTKQRYSVGVIFGRSCQILLLQLLRTSREQIRQRQGNGTYSQNFERAIIPQLREIEELLTLRATLQAFGRFMNVMRLYRRHDVERCLNNWSPADSEPRNRFLEGSDPLCSRIIDIVSSSPPAYVQAYLNRTSRGGSQEGTGEQEGEGAIIIEGDTYRIRDQRGILWSLEGLEYAIPTRRGIVEYFDPIVKQLVDLPEQMARFEALGVEEGLRHLLIDIMCTNRGVTRQTRESWGYAFRASKIHENLRGPTVRGTDYELKGIHRVTHEQIGDCFEGDHSYAAAINSLFRMEQGFENLRNYAEDVLSIGLSAIAAVCPPMVVAELGFELATGLIQYSEAQERERIYESLLHPEQVLTRAEVEIDLFVARFALKLQIVLGPVGAGGDVMRILRRTGLLRSVAREGSERAARAAGGQGERLTRAVVRQSRNLLENLGVALMRETLTDQIGKLLLQQFLPPIVRRIARETTITGSVGGLEGMQLTLLMLRAERAARERRGRLSQPSPTITGVGEGTSGN